MSMLEYTSHISLVFNKFTIFIEYYSFICLLYAYFSYNMAKEMQLDDLKIYGVIPNASVFYMAAPNLSIKQKHVSQDRHGYFWSCIDDPSGKMEIVVKLLELYLIETPVSKRISRSPIKYYCEPEDEKVKYTLRVVNYDISYDIESKCVAIKFTMSYPIIYCHELIIDEFYKYEIIPITCRPPINCQGCNFDFIRCISSVTENEILNYIGKIVNLKYPEYNVNHFTHCRETIHEEYDSMIPNVELMYARHKCRELTMSQAKDVYKILNLSIGMCPYIDYMNRYYKMAMEDDIYVKCYSSNKNENENEFKVCITNRAHYFSNYTFPMLAHLWEKDLIVEEVYNCVKDLPLTICQMIGEILYLNTTYNSVLHEFIEKIRCG